jgi:hypothetical protein
MTPIFRIIAFVMAFAFIGHAYGSFRILITGDDFNDTTQMAERVTFWGRLGCGIYGIMALGLAFVMFAYSLRLRL